MYVPNKWPDLAKLRVEILNTVSQSRKRENLLISRPSPNVWKASDKIRPFFFFFFFVILTTETDSSFEHSRTWASQKLGTTL